MSEKDPLVSDLVGAANDAAPALILTPGGPLPAEQVVPIASGSTVDVQAPPPPGDDHHFKAMVEGQPLRGNWVNTAYCTAPGPIDLLVADIVIPQDPPRNGQTMFIFTGLEDQPVTRLLQPVIQWDAPAGPAGWSLSSWFVDTKNRMAYPTSPAVPVTAGTTVRARITRARQTPAGHEYQCGFDGYAASLALPPGPALSLALCVLESYNMQGCGDYPPNSPIRFSKVQMRPLTGGWATRDYIIGCGENAQIVSANDPCIFDLHTR